MMVLSLSMAFVINGVINMRTMLLISNRSEGTAK